MWILLGKTVAKCLVFCRTRSKPHFLSAEVYLDKAYTLTG